MGLNIGKVFKKITKTVKKVVNNPIVNPIGYIASKATGFKNATDMYKVGAAGALTLGGLSKLFSGGSAAGNVVADAASTAGEEGASTSGFLGGLGNMLSGLFTGGSNGSSFLGGLVNSGLGLLGSQYTADKQLQRDLQLQDQAFAKNVAMWNAQNAYNTPLAQMERYKQAGLNPNLIYGNGVSSAGNASSAPSYEAPKYKGIDLQSILMFQQLANMNAQQELLANQTELARIQATGASLDNDVKAVNAAYATDMADANLAIKRADARATNANADATEHGDTNGFWSGGFWRKAFPGLANKIGELKAEHSAWKEKSWKDWHDEQKQFYNFFGN